MRRHKVMTPDQRLDAARGTAATAILAIWTAIKDLEQATAEIDTLSGEYFDAAESMERQAKDLGHEYFDLRELRVGLGEIFAAYANYDNNSKN